MSPWIANCTFIRPTTSSARAISAVWRRSSSCRRFGSEYGGSEQAESPEWMPACSMCSMIPPIMTSLAVAEAVDVDLDRVVEEAVEQYRRLLADLDRLAHVALEVLLPWTISIARPPST